MRIFHRTAVGLAVIVALVVTSCTVKEEITLTGQGSGSAVVRVELHPILVAYYGDLMTAMTGVDGEVPVFDLDQLTLAFAEHPSVRLLRVERRARGSLQLEVAFDDVNAVFSDADLDGSGLFSFRTVGSQRELTVRLDQNTVGRFLAFAPPESAMMSEFLLPPRDGSVSRTEYQEELGWALEEYAPSAEVQAALSQAAIEVAIRPTGTIQSQTGGTVREDGAVVFRVPVMELLTLTEPLIYQVVFNP